MTNQGVVGYPAAQDGSIPLGKLSAPQGFGRLVSGRYYFTSSAFSTNTSNALGVGTLRAAPWVVPNAVNLAKIGGEITSAGEAGSKLRLGLYADDGTGYPGALVLDAGTIAGDSNTVQEVVTAGVLSPGVYWAAAAVQVVSVTQPTVRCTNVSSAMLNLSPGTSIPASNATFCGFAAASAATAAFPSVYPSGGAITTLVPRLFVKIT